MGGKNAERDANHFQLRGIYFLSPFLAVMEQRREKAYSHVNKEKVKVCAKRTSSHVSHVRSGSVSLKAEERKAYKRWQA